MHEHVSSPYSSPPNIKSTYKKNTKKNSSVIHITCTRRRAHSYSYSTCMRKSNQKSRDCAQRGVRTAVCGFSSQLACNMRVPTHVRGLRFDFNTNSRRAQFALRAHSCLHCCFAVYVRNSAHYSTTPTLSAATPAQQPPPPPCACNVCALCAPIPFTLFIMLLPSESLPPCTLSALMQPLSSRLVQTISAVSSTTSTTVRVCYSRQPPCTESTQNVPPLVKLL